MRIQFCQHKSKSFVQQLRVEIIQRLLFIQNASHGFATTVFRIWLIITKVRFTHTVLVMKNRKSKKILFFWKIKNPKRFYFFCSLNLKNQKYKKILFVLFFCFWKIPKSQKYLFSLFFKLCVENLIQGYNAKRSYICVSMGRY